MTSMQQCNGCLNEYECVIVPCNLEFDFQMENCINLNEISVIFTCKHGIIKFEENNTSLLLQVTLDLRSQENTADVSLMAWVSRLFFIFIGWLLVIVPEKINQILIF